MRFLGYMSLWARPVRSRGERREVPAHHEEDHPTVARMSDGEVLTTDGPFAEAKEHLAGFFIIDCGSRKRAEEIAAQFAQPGGMVELRPVMWPGGDDQ